MNWHLHPETCSNEWYARDISKKRRISTKIKGKSRTDGILPMDITSDPNNPKHWVIDEEAAHCPAHFDMTLEGFGTETMPPSLKRKASRRRAGLEASAVLSTKTPRHQVEWLHDYHLLYPAGGILVGYVLNFKPTQVHKN